jgi:hypothetical protein
MTDQVSGPFYLAYVTSQVTMVKRIFFRLMHPSFSIMSKYWILLIAVALVAVGFAGCISSAPATVVTSVPTSTTTTTIVAPTIVATTISTPQDPIIGTWFAYDYTGMAISRYRFYENNSYTWGTIKSRKSYTEESGTWKKLNGYYQLHWDGRKGEFFRINLDDSGKTLSYPQYDQGGEPNYYKTVFLKDPALNTVQWGDFKLLEVRWDNNPWPLEDRGPNVLWLDKEEWNQKPPGVNEIRGTIENIGTITYPFVQVEINLYDSNDVQVGNLVTNVSNLEPGGKWNFKTLVPDKSATRCKVKNITGY